MPRISPRLIWQARAIDPLLPQLLPVCRDLRSSQLELRWLRDYAARNQTSEGQIYTVLNGLVKRRSRGEPLQYILGTEFFGDLEIQCRPGVLIPRFVLVLPCFLLIPSDSVIHADKRRQLQFRILLICYREVPRRISIGFASLTSAPEPAASHCYFITISILTRLIRTHHSSLMVSMCPTMLLHWRARINALNYKWPSNLHKDKRTSALALWRK